MHTTNDTLDQVVETAPEAVLVLDDKHVVRYMNRAAKALFGPTAEGRKFDELRAGNTPAIVGRSTGILISAGKDATIIQLKKAGGGEITAAMREVPNDGEKTLYINDISSQVAYWQKVHGQKETENKLYRSQHIRSGNLSEAIREIIEMTAATMNVERVNIWRIDDNFNSITSLGNYDSRKGMLPNVTLKRTDMPAYFQLLASEELILTSDSVHDPLTKELVEGYLVPNGILSMMDVPVRIEGRMAAVICFEETKQKRSWDASEQMFGISVSQIIALTLETHARQEAQQHLETALGEKKLLLREMNHRVKNSFELIADIMRLQADESQDETIRKLLNDSRGRLNSIATIHRLLYQGDNISSVNFRDFLLDLSGHYRSIFTSDHITIVTLLDPVQLPMSKAVFAGLIVNELIANSTKHAFGKSDNNTITIRLQLLGPQVNLSISDNGKGLAGGKEENIGLPLVREFVERLKGTLQHETKNGSHFTLKFAAK